MSIEKETITSVKNKYKSSLNKKINYIGKECKNFTNDKRYKLLELKSNVFIIETNYGWYQYQMLRLLNFETVQQRRKRIIKEICD